MIVLLSWDPVELQYIMNSTVMMKATLSGLELFVISYSWSNDGVVYMGSCGTTIHHTFNYHIYVINDFGNVRPMQMIWYKQTG